MKILINIYLYLFAKWFGKVWVFACIPFRAWARSYVYNHVLQNKLPLKRLYERNPTWGNYNGEGWTLDNIHHLDEFNTITVRGFIRYRKTNKWVFYFIVWVIWGWLDDDSNQDTTDTGYIKTLLDGSRKSWHIIFRPWLRKVDTTRIVYGNGFDLGDVRAEYPFYDFFATFVWNDRNTSQNLQYLFLNY